MFKLHILLLITLTHRADANFYLQADCDGFYQVFQDSELWLTSAPTTLRADGRLYSSENGSLEVVKCAQGDDSDPLGHYNWTKWFWSRGMGVEYTTEVRSYPQDGIATFWQEFPNGVKGTTSGDRECDYKAKPWIGCDWKGLTSSFPAFRLPSNHTNQKNDLAWMEVYGEHLLDAHNMTHRGPRMGRWLEGSDIPDGLLSGPLAILDRNATSLIISPLTHFMDFSTEYKSSYISWGPMGGVMSVPKGYRIGFILTVAHGVNLAFDKWGSCLLKYHGNDRKGSDGRQQIKGRGGKIETHLGYDTDNGAYYYYNPIPGTDYGETLRRIHRYLEQEDIPAKWANLDSWRYYKGPGNTGGEGVPMMGGVKNWTADATVIYNGDQEINTLGKDTGWPWMAHNRWWQNVTDYATENGGRFDFILETQSKAYPGQGFALPNPMVKNSGDFWAFLMDFGQSWGLKLYEQDWLWTQFLGMEATTRQVYIAEQWMEDMATAAEERGLSVQYCMVLPRHAMQSARSPAVSQIRVSDDYGPSDRDGQWRIGRSSIIAASLALAPYKDPFFTTTKNETGGNVRGPEPYPALQAAVATFSMGPVAFCDGIGFEDKDLIMRSVNAEGEILRPDIPMTCIDSLLVEEAFSSHFKGIWPNGRHRSEIWASRTSLSEDLSWFQVMIADNPGEYREIYLDEVFKTTKHKHTSSTQQRFVEYSVPALSMNINNISIRILDPKGPFLKVQGLELPDFNVRHVAPIIQDIAGNTDIVILGELSKWVPISRQRVVNIVRAPGNLIVDLRGSSGELVEFYFGVIEKDSVSILSSRCVIRKDLAQLALTLNSTKQPEASCKS